MISLKALLFVFLGGGLGSIMRYTIGQILAGYSEKFPYGTLIANVLSCILLGYLIAISVRQNLSPEMKLFLMVGICGGFSTFSTFSAESYQLFNTASPFLALVYMGLSFTICLIAIYTGMRLGS